MHRGVGLTVNRWFYSTLVVGLSLVSSAHAAPKPGSLEADIETIRTKGQWLARESFVGWTANHRAVYRSLLCDQDKGGGRGPNCMLEQCVVAADPADQPRTTSQLDGECETLLSLDLWDAVKADAARKAVDPTAIAKASSDALAGLGTLAPGKPLPASTIRTSTANLAVTLSRTGKAGNGEIVVFRHNKQSDTGMAETTSGVTISQVVASPDNKCVAVTGHFMFRSDYERVRTTSPIAFGKVRCD